MFSKILIANRGEIACRVAATARRLGVRTVAVCSDVDAHAKHVAMCDEVVNLGGAAPKDSYLRWQAIIDAALATGAQAVHPGYGFLSENEAFADACAQAGLVFIGPPSSAIQAMGLKARHDQIGIAARIDHYGLFRQRVADDGAVALQGADGEGFTDQSGRGVVHRMSSWR